MPAAPTESQQLVRNVEGAQALEGWRAKCPADLYKPHGLCLRGPFAGRPSGQLQFHVAPHTIRIAAPGNGWGGTTAMACEIDAWMRHLRRWQDTPAWPCTAIWFCPQYKQFAQVKDQLETWAFGRIPRFTEAGIGGPRYVWPDGGTMYLGSYDSDWTHYEGIEKDLIAFDEQPPRQLWERMMMRHRGARAARFICKATQAQGASWMGGLLYEDWKAHHQRLGIFDEEAMLEAQAHPHLWLWPRGGPHDNPATSDQKIAFLEAQRFSSVKARKVSLFGGFESFVGDPVFDEEAIERLRERARRFQPAARFADIVALDDQEARALDTEEALAGREEPRPLWQPE